MIKRVLIFGLFSLFLFAGCGQKEKPRYDPQACPFCVDKPGTCLYCDGKGTCSFCKGEKTRHTQTLGSEDGSVAKIDLPEPCPFCKATGKCHYCEGKKQCRVCKGTGKITEWKW